MHHSDPHSTALDSQAVSPTMVQLTQTQTANAKAQHTAETSPHGNTSRHASLDVAAPFKPIRCSLLCGTSTSAY